MHASSGSSSLGEHLCSPFKFEDIGFGLGEGYSPSRTTTFTYNSNPYNSNSLNSNLNSFTYTSSSTNMQVAGLLEDHKRTQGIVGNGGEAREAREDVPNNNSNRGGFARDIWQSAQLSAGAFSPNPNAISLNNASCLDIFGASGPNVDPKCGPNAGSLLPSGSPCQAQAANGDNWSPNAGASAVPNVPNQGDADYLTGLKQQLTSTPGARDAPPLLNMPITPLQGISRTFHIFPCVWRPLPSYIHHNLKSAL